MKREMTDEQKQRMMAARAETMDALRERRSKSLKVGEWEVFRADEDNWVLRKGQEGNNRYYPTQSDALKALLHERIGDAQATSISAMLTAVKKAELEIVTAASG